MGRTKHGVRKVGGYFSMKCNGINQGNCDLTRGNGTLGGIKPHALGLKISF